MISPYSTISLASGKEINKDEDQDSEISDTEPRANRFQIPVARATDLVAGAGPGQSLSPTPGSNAFSRQKDDDTHKSDRSKSRSIVQEYALGISEVARSLEGDVSYTMRKRVEEGYGLNNVISLSVLEICSYR